MRFLMGSHVHRRQRWTADHLLARRHRRLRLTLLRCSGMVAIASIAFRFDYNRTVLAAIMDSAGYLLMIVLMGQLTDVTGVVVRIGYIFLVGAIGAEAAREGYQQIRSRLELRDRMRLAEEAEAQFRAGDR